jgi:hypothetical protein
VLAAEPILMMLPLFSPNFCAARLEVRSSSLSVGASRIMTVPSHPTGWEARCYVIFIFRLCGSRAPGLP